MSTERKAVVVRAEQPIEQEDPLACPRCTSTNTKFCYYNNYNLSQPRHFCKSCRRYWTHGGTLRDIPVGGVSHKTAKRSRTNNNATSSPPSSVATTTTQQAPLFVSMPLSGGGGGFTSLLGLGGFGLGLGLGLDDVGLGRGVWAFPQNQHHEVGLYENGGGGGSGESENRSDTWQIESGADCFSFT